MGEFWEPTLRSRKLDEDELDGKTDEGCYRKEKMNQQGRNSRVIIGSSCMTCVLFVTLWIPYVHVHYGVVGPFAVIMIAEFFLQLYKMVYECYASRGKFDLRLAIRITNCWTIYQILNMTFLTGGLFTYLIMLAEIEALHIPKSFWLVAIIVLACVWSIWPIQSFVRKEKYEGERRHLTKLISSFVPRFVILYTFLVYYFIAYVDSIEMNFIPALCVVYLGVDRLISMFNTVREYEQQEYYSLFRNRVRWITKRRNV